MRFIWMKKIFTDCGLVMLHVHGIDHKYDWNQTFFNFPELSQIGQNINRKIARMD